MHHAGHLPDFIFAKAALALEQNASMPVFNTEHRIRIRQGRHPLLDEAEGIGIRSLQDGDNIGHMGRESTEALLDTLFVTDVCIDFPENRQLEDAKRHIAEDKESFEDLLADLENSRLTIEKERTEKLRQLFCRAG